MRRLGLVLLAALVGCGSPDDDGGGATAAVDAGRPPDAATHGDPPVGPSDVERTPFTTSGTTPSGSLDDVRFMSVAYVGGHCPGTYYLNLYQTDAPEDPPVVMFSVTIPRNATQPPTGTVMASARAGSASTDQASFEIVHLDIPPPDDTQTLTVRIAGHLTANAPGWNVDFNVDATTPNMVCLIL